MYSAREVLDDDGPLAAGVEGFRVRPSQIAMAERIEAALADRERLIVESGTGTGKTFAYLIPLLLSGRTAIVSTGTRHLQDQLYQRDLPVVRDALALPVRTALLKGRANYLCRYRLEAVRSLPLPVDTADDLARVERWAGVTTSGDVSEAADVPDGARVWPLVTSTPDSCLGTRCPMFDDCHVVEARRAALAAEIVVVNHHLFFADLVLREDGFGELLPGVEAVIFDEAHQLPDIASVFLGTSLSTNQLVDLARDVVRAEATDGSGVGALVGASRLVETSAAALRDQAADAPARGSQAGLDAIGGFASALSDLRRHLQTLGELLDGAAVAGPGLERCAERARTLALALDTVTGRVAGEAEELVRWYQLGARAMQLHATPLEAGERMRARLLEPGRSWVFTSATLSVGEDFSHFQRLMGLEEAATARWDSPFEFERQSLLYLPRGLPPSPMARDYTATVVERAREVIEAAGGRTFVLFTSFRALNEARDRLVSRLDYPLLVQGDAPKAELIARFARLGNAVLLGTASFWEGVDVRGAALACVVIDKLPFSPPDDPVLKARLERVQAEGGNPFMSWQVPQAVIGLKQGAGRLIRAVDDYGVLVLCDPRLVDKPYGRRFLQSLPPMPRTRDLADVERFFAATRDGEARYSA